MSGKVISNLSVGLFGDVSHFAKAFGKEAKESAERFGDSLKEMGSKALELSGVGAMIGGAFEGVMEIGKGFKLAAEFDKAKVSLGAFVGGASQAETILNQLKEIAVKSPFELSDLSGAARQLAAFGTEADQVAPTVKMLGDIAAGSGTSVDELAQLYIRVKDEGVLAGREIREFTNAGIPLTQALAKSLGQSPIQIRAMAEEGKITFPMVQQAMINMTRNGGAFNDMMRKQAGTFGGMWTVVSHTIDDNLEKIANAFASAFDGDKLGDFTHAIDVLGDVLAKVAGFIGKVVNVVADIVDKLLPMVNAITGKEVAAPKIAPIPPQDLTLTPHIEKAPLVKWGSAEMYRIMHDWQGQTAKVFKQKPPPPKPIPDVRMDPVKGGFLAQAAGRFDDYVKRLREYLKSPAQKREESLKNSGTSSKMLSEHIQIGPHNEHILHSDAPFSGMKASILPRPVPDPDAPANSIGGRAWKELQDGKAKIQTIDDRSATSTQQNTFQMWLLMKNQQVAQF